MKNHFYLIFISCLLLITISYAQVLHKVIVEENVINTEFADCGEESTEKTSEENTRETDQDEDTFRIVEMIALHSANFLTRSKNENYSFGLLAHYPEIVSPPPQR